jgi:hypothetical protein
MLIKSKKINSGLYQIAVNTHIFQVEKFPDASWYVFLLLPNGAREWYQDFHTKRDDAVNYIIKLDICVDKLKVR